MAVLYNEFKMPQKIKWNTEECTDVYAKFVAEPFERGFGHTIGNALRRALLSSLESLAIASFRIEGVSHEYMSVDGIVEDVVDIVLNIKSALLKKNDDVEDGIFRETRFFSKTIDVTEELLTQDGQYKQADTDNIQE